MLKYLNYNQYLGYGAIGSASGSSELASIIYNMDVFNVDIDSLRTIYNDGQNGSTSDAPIYASNHIFLDPNTQSVDYPIPNTGGTGSFLTYFDTATKSHVTLGNSVDGGSSADVVLNGTFDVDLSDWDLGANWVWDNGEAKSSTAAEILRQEGSIEGGKRYLMTVRCRHEVSGNANIYLGTGNFITLTLTTEMQTFTFESVAIDAKIYLYNISGTVVYFDDVVIKEILPISTTYTQTNSHSNTFTTTAPLTDLDRSLLNLKPESIARLVDGETVSELSFDLTDIEAFYPGNEGEASGAYIQDVKTALGSDVIINGAFNNWTADNPDSWIPFGTEDATNYVTENPTSVANIVSDGLLMGFRQDVLTVGKYYTVNADVTVNSGVGIRFQLGSNGTSILIPSTISFSGVYLCDGTDGNLLVVRQGATDTQIDNISLKEATVAEIINYAPTCRTNLDLTNYGASNFLYNQDATGRFTGMADAGTIVGANDGRNIDIQMTIPYNHLVTKDIDKIEGTLDSCTITYVDTTTEIVP